MRLRPVVIAASAAAATCAPLALAWAGHPAAPPPKPATPTGPPPAWAETPSTSSWLAYSAYCWKTVCAEYLPPASRPNLPTIRIARGTTVRAHFAFQPSKLSITTLGATTSTRSLAPARVARWRPTAAGVTTLSLKNSAGSVGYVVRVRFR